LKKDPIPVPAGMFKGQYMPMVGLDFGLQILKEGCSGTEKHHKSWIKL
jgi:hypothetical protein